MSTDTIGEMKGAKKILKKRGARIINVFPPSAFISKLTEEEAQDIGTLGFIQGDILWIC